MTTVVELYDFWFSEPIQKLWFNQSNSFDIEISVKYTELLLSYEKIDIDIKNTKQLVGYIILLDQIPRHIYRNDIDCVNKYLQTILSFISDNSIIQKINSGSIESEIHNYDLCFILLPLRHSNTYDNFITVVNIIWKRIEQQSDNEIYRKFLKASYERFNNHEIVLNDLTIDNTSKSIQYTDSLFLNKINENHVAIISLSGGVDSMVLAYHLKVIHGLECVAVHINYSNREECIDEQRMVQDYCSKLNIPCYISTINEIKREPCMKYGFRDLYETYTKKVRFNAYKHIIKKSMTYGVYMGHNRDDCFENILTNIATKNHYDNLWGMSNDTVIDGIRFIRPMLNVNKSDIYSFAKKYNIPYTCDSTPSWSQRGQIRDVVKPTLSNWNPEIIDGIMKLSEYMKDSNIIVKQYAKSLVDDKGTIKYTFRYGIESCITEENEIPSSISTLVWQEIFKQQHIHITSKTLSVFIQKLNDIISNVERYIERKKHGHKLYHILNDKYKAQLDVYNNYINISFLLYL